ncbi:hypothetical protein ACHAQH_008500 [Verticillium albo-atrum]
MAVPGVVLDISGLGEFNIYLWDHLGSSGLPRFLVTIQKPQTSAWENEKASTMRAPSPRHVLAGVVSLIVTVFVAQAYRDALVDTVRSKWRAHETVATSNGFPIRDKVATITDTFFAPHLIPLILYFHAVLGPSWPIVFFTSQSTYDEHFSPNASSESTSAIWRRAVDAGSIETRIVSPEFNLTTRKGVNLYFSHPWLWEQLAPAKHVLVFQADAILCANAHRSVDDFLQYDFIGAPLSDTRKVYNGGLSLRNRTMLLDVLNGGNDWWTDWNTKGTEYGGHGEDVWMSILMRGKGANMPSIEEALAFSRQLPWHMDRPGRPIGYHRVYKQDKRRVPEAREWCPEIDLSSPGLL